MVLKPIPLSAFAPSFVPPVTGVFGSLAPVANSFDPSGLFAPRGRTGSASKRMRSEEIDCVFDRNAEYPPNQPPQKQSVNMGVIRGLVVAASTAGGEARDLMNDPSLDPKIKIFGNLCLSVLSAVEAMLECGLAPISAGLDGRGGGYASAAKKSQAPPTAPRPIPAGLAELKEGLKKADLESVLFDADLGPLPVANRAALASALSSGLRAAAISKAGAAGGDPVEAIRVMEDALSCVTDMEFLGQKSKKFIGRTGESDPRTNKFCTMPIKLKFDDRSARINFERSIQSNCGLRAIMSIPPPIRTEQATFGKAVRERYPNKIVMVRPDIEALELVAFHKEDGGKRWLRCPETLAIPREILLPQYVPRQSIVLPPKVSLETGDKDMDTDEAAAFAAATAAAFAAT